MLSGSPATCGVLVDGIAHASGAALPRIDLEAKGDEIAPFCKVAMPRHMRDGRIVRRPSPCDDHSLHPHVGGDSGTDTSDSESSSDKDRGYVDEIPRARSYDTSSSTSSSSKSEHKGKRCTKADGGFFCCHSPAASDEEPGRRGRRCDKKLADSSGSDFEGKKGVVHHANIREGEFPPLLPLPAPAKLRSVTDSSASSGSETPPPVAYVRPKRAADIIP
jgi:hypothetical protein